MYLNHYQLNLMPFEIGPDPKFLWLGEKHEEAFAILQYGILESKGFIVIIGEPGTGKSTLLNAAVANFGSNIRFAKISDPALSEMEFFHFVANALEMERSFHEKSEFLIELGKFVKEAGARSRKILLVIDEAQRLTPGMLEQIRVLSNIETPGQKVLSCIFAGQPEFLGLFRYNPALSQRIFLSHIIHPLTQSETEKYITHRLKIAGRKEPLFTAPAVQEIYRLTRGNPRLINILCDQALLIGYSNYLETIGAEIIEEGAKNTPIAMQSLVNVEAAEIDSETTAQSPLSAQAVVPVKAFSLIAPKFRNTNAFKRKTGYYAAIALIVSIAVAALLYWNEGFRAVRLDSRRETKAIADNTKTIEPVRTEVDIARFQGQILELSRQKEEAETHFGELQRRFGALEGEHHRLKALIKEMKAKEPASTASVTPTRAVVPSPPPDNSSDQAHKEPDPAAAVDFVMKKRTP
jgi:general secretion pathway protein A